MNHDDANRAYDVLLQARELGADADLSDWIESAVSEWRDPDRAWRLKNPIGSVNQLATEFSRLSGLEIDRCLDIARVKAGDCEIAVRIQAILEFGKQLSSARRRSA